MSGVLVLKVTVRPEPAVAESVALVPTSTGLAGAVKLIVCAEALTVTLHVTLVAAP